MRLGVLVASLIVLVVSGCAGQSKNEKRKEDASNYNTQLGIDYMNQGDIPLAKEKLDRALKENPNNAKVHTAIASSSRPCAWRRMIPTSPTTTRFICARLVRTTRA
jgi:Tfp pilus assembly protein PilF